MQFGDVTNLLNPSTELVSQFQPRAATPSHKDDYKDGTNETTPTSLASVPYHQDEYFAEVQKNCEVHSSCSDSRPSEHGCRTSPPVPSSVGFQIDVKVGQSGGNDLLTSNTLSTISYDQLCNGTVMSGQYGCHERQLQEPPEEEDLMAFVMGLPSETGNYLDS